MTVTITISQAPVTSVEADAVVIGVVQDPDGPRLAVADTAADTAAADGLVAALTALGATGELEELTKIPANGLFKAPLVLAVGLGQAPADGQPFSAETLRRAAGAALRNLTGSKRLVPDNGRRKITVALPAAQAGQAEAIATGAALGGYSFHRYRSATPASTEVTVLTSDQQAVDRGAKIAAAVALTRDLVNTAPGHLAPADVAAKAQEIAAEKGLRFEVLDENQLREQGYGGIVAVGQGSTRPPRLVRVAHSHPEATKTVVFVGKGITFDSGGLSLKPPKSMETMKSDMAGAAAVLAAAVAAADLGLKANVISYLPLAENMPGGAAQRPSDVITIYGGKGKTVEVLNTDAEGRLVLADGLARSAEDDPDLVIDVATLTGAAVVALGKRTAGVMGSDDETAAAIARVMRDAGEPAWPMPLPDELRKGLDSLVADMTNVSADRTAGMLVAGVFLREFVPDGVRWAHLDIAGPAFNESPAFGYTPKGGTGAAVRALVAIAAEVAQGRLVAG